MKKKILSLAMVAISLVSMSAFAQSAKNAKSDNVCTEQKCELSADCKNKQCSPGECGPQMCKKGQKKACAFEGLNLTDAQKEQLKAIKAPAKRAAERNAAERKQRVENAKADRAAYLKEVKAVLTPEQYVQFLENNYVDRMPNRKARPGMKQGAPAGRDNKARENMARKDRRPAGPSITASGKK